MGAGVEQGSKADWAHVYLTVLPQLPAAATGKLAGVAADEAAAAAFRATAAVVMARHSARLRRAAVAQWEVRLRTADGSGAWRIVASSPTGIVGVEIIIIS